MVKDDNLKINFKKGFKAKEYYIDVAGIWADDSFRLKRLFDEKEYTVTKKYDGRLTAIMVNVQDRTYKFITPSSGEEYKLDEDTSEWHKERISEYINILTDDVMATVGYPAETKSLVFLAERLGRIDLGGLGGRKYSALVKGKTDYRECTKGSHFCIFDVLTDEEYFQGFHNDPKDTRTLLRYVQADLTGGAYSFEVIKPLDLTTVSEIKEYLKENPEVEGVMCKTVEAPKKRSARTDEFIKIKRANYVACKIEDTIKGKKGGKYEDLVGTLCTVVLNELGEETLTRIKAGAGLSEWHREMGDELIGRRCTIKYEYIDKETGNYIQPRVYRVAD